MLLVETVPVLVLVQNFLSGLPIYSFYFLQCWSTVYINYIIKSRQCWSTCTCTDVYPTVYLYLYITAFCTRPSAPANWEVSEDIQTTQSPNLTRQVGRGTYHREFHVSIFNRQSNPVAVHLHDRVPVVGQGQEQPHTWKLSR